MKYSGALAAFMLLILLASTSEATISCGVVTIDLEACDSYLKNGSGKPPAACCSGLKALQSALTTTEDKKAACNCVKSISKSYNTDLAEDLPGNCGISLSISISPNADCTNFGWNMEI